MGWYGGLDVTAPVRSWLLDTAEPRLARLGDRTAEQRLSLSLLRHG